MRRRLMVLATLACTIGILIAFAVPALGAPETYDLEWSKQGHGANHSNATAKAMQIVVNRGGVSWVDNIALEHSKYPDSVFGDHIDHNANWWGSYPSYYGWGNRFGNPQDKAQKYYERAVASLRQGDRIEASKNLGYASHYLMDVNGPLHTQESRTETQDFHGEVEHAAAGVDLNGYVADDGYQKYGGQPSLSALTVTTAYASHEYYSDLVNTFDKSGFNSHVRDIEGVNWNRGVNALADMIQSAWADADGVSAVIDSISPSASTTGTIVTFRGHGVDVMGHGIAETRWRSSRDGVLSSPSNPPTSTPSLGIHNIFFKVRCAGPSWSAETFLPIVVGAENTKPRAMYRFFNARTGVHFYTATEQEMLVVRNTMASTYNLEGVAYALDTSSTANSAPLYRFYNNSTGVHFYTKDPTEKATLMGNPAFKYDGPVASVSPTPVPGGGTVWRFYNVRKGTHFYTASAAERDTINSLYGATYNYEGTAYYFDPPW